MTPAISHISQISWLDTYLAFRKRDTTKTMAGVIREAAIQWLKYCRYGENPNQSNQSTLFNQSKFVFEKIKYKKWFRRREKMCTSFTVKNSSCPLAWNIKNARLNNNKFRTDVFSDVIPNNAWLVAFWKQWVQYVFHGKADYFKTIMQLC